MKYCCFYLLSWKSASPEIPGAHDSRRNEHSWQIWFYSSWQSMSAGAGTSNTQPRTRVPLSPYMSDSEELKERLVHDSQIKTIFFHHKIDHTCIYIYASVMPSAFVSVPIGGWLVSCYQESDNDNMSDWSVLVFVDFRPAAAECEQNRPCGLDKDLSEAQFEWSRQNLGACCLNIFSYKGDHYLELFGFKWPYFPHLFIIFQHWNLFRDLPCAVPPTKW